MAGDVRQPALSARGSGRDRAHGTAGSTSTAQAEAVLRETQEFYVVLDELGVVRVWNRAAERIFGYTAQQALGTALAELIVPRDLRAAHRRGIEAFTRTGHGRGVDAPIEVDALRADGTEVPVHLTIWAQQTDHGHLFHALGSDLTERRRLERVLRVLADHRRALLLVDRPAQVPQVVVDGLRQATSCDGAWLFLPDPLVAGVLRLSAQARSSEGFAVPAGTVVRSGADPTTSVREHLPPDVEVDVEVVELGTAASGVLAVTRRGGPDALPGGAGDLLRLFAAEAGLVLQRLSLHERLAAAAHTDSLTGLANRRAFDEALVRCISHARRASAALALVLLDLDHFKAYNDTYGHPAGDELLQRVTAGWSGVVRAPDLLARLGGDEFALLLPGADDGAAATAVARLAGVTPGGTSFGVGIGTLHPDDGPRDLLSRADAALYDSKRSRRRR